MFDRSTPTGRPSILTTLLRGKWAQSIVAKSGTFPSLASRADNPSGYKALMIEELASETCIRSYMKPVATPSLKAMPRMAAVTTETVELWQG